MLLDRYLSIRVSADVVNCESQPWDNSPTYFSLLDGSFLGRMMFINAPNLRSSMTSEDKKQ